MARETDEPRHSLTRRTTPSPLDYGRTAYVLSGGGVSVVIPPGRLGRWFQRANEWAETLIGVIEKLDDATYHPEPPSVRRDLQPSNQVSQVLHLVGKGGHVLVLAAYLPYGWTKHRFGFR